VYGLDTISILQRQYSSVWNMPDNRLGPAQWVNAGLRALAKSGFSALKADTLANSLGVSRGSFYWHFADVSAFHAAILRRWREIALENIIAELEGTADGRLEALIDRAFAAGSGIERAVRAWATADARARRGGCGADPLSAKNVDRSRRPAQRGRTARAHHELVLSRVRAVVEQAGRRCFATHHQGPDTARTLESWAIIRRRVRTPSGDASGAPPSVTLLFFGPFSRT
jgi:AcrR family transcriptional regulator